MRLVRRDQLTPMPWKNGGGVTYELAAFPEGAPLDGFLWRISMAEVTSDGPFSAFDGIDRTLTLLEGAGLDLDFAGSVVRLDAGSAPLSFPGEAPVTGRPVSGPILDLNVMTRRGSVGHSVALARALPGGLIPAGTVAVVARGEGVVGDQPLTAGEALLTDGAALTGLRAKGDLIVIKIMPFSSADGA